MPSISTDTDAGSKLILADGRIIENSSCGYYGEDILWCFLSNVSLAKAFQYFSFPAQYNTIVYQMKEPRYLNTYTYTGIETLLDIKSRGGETSVQLKGSNIVETIERTIITDKGMSGGPTAVAPSYRVVMGNGTVISDSRCSYYGSDGLLCTLANVTFNDVFQYFSALSNYSTITFETVLPAYTDKCIYTGITGISLIKQQTEAIDVQLIGDIIETKQHIVNNG